MTIFWPSTHPSSRSLCRNASSRGGLSEGDVRLRKPIRGTLPACCASAASGAARTPRARTTSLISRMLPRGVVEGPQTHPRPGHGRLVECGRARRGSSRRPESQTHWNTLVKPMPSGLNTPSLAESWTMSKDGRIWEFVLRKGPRFHNVDPVTAEDVKFSFERYRGAAAPLFKARVREVQVVDASRVRFILPAPWPDFLNFSRP